MSAFRKRTATGADGPPHGTRASALPPFRPLLSSGIASLDDVLGGGFPLPSSALVLAPDPHSAWGALVQKYFIAQGIVSAHTVYVVGPSDQVDDLLRSCMWLPPQQEPTPATDAHDDPDVPTDDPVRIAWRYEGMKRFSTTVPHESSESPETSFCASFDLTRTVPEHVLLEARKNGQLVTVDTRPDDDLETILKKVNSTVKQQSPSTHSSLSRTVPAVRLALPFILDSVASSQLRQSHLVRFLHALRYETRLKKAASLVTLPPHISAPCLRDPFLAAVTQWSDTAITLLSDPLSPLPSHQGLVQIHKPPSIDCLIPPSDKLSTLRGLGQAAATSGTSGRGENNLAFRCKRRQFVIETLHLDVEGGVGERRTEHEGMATLAKQAGVVSVPEPVEVALHDRRELSGVVSKHERQAPKERLQKKVAFSDADDLYDF